MRKNKPVIIAGTVILSSMAGCFFWMNATSSSPFENKTEAGSQSPHKTGAASMNTQKVSRTTPEFDAACANLPSEIDPAEDALMQLSFKCHEKDGLVKKTHAKLPPFNMPDTSWAEKKINFKGKIITYKFGDGNPAEVALKPEDYNGSKGVYEDYVTPEAEKNLYEFLSSPLLKKVIDKCGSTMGRDAVDLSVPLIHNFAAVLDDKEISMEKMLRIDRETGRKYIDYDRTIALAGSLRRLDHPLAQSQGKKLKYQCLNFYELTDLKNLDQQFSRFSKSYVNGPSGYSSDDPNNPDYVLEIRRQSWRALDTLRVLDIWGILGNLWR